MPPRTSTLATTRTSCSRSSYATTSHQWSHPFHVFPQLGQILIGHLEMGAGCFLPTVLSRIISTMPLAKVVCGSVAADPNKHSVLNSPVARMHKQKQCVRPRPTRTTHYVSRWSFCRLERLSSRFRLNFSPESLFKKLNVTTAPAINNIYPEET